MQIRRHPIRNPALRRITQKFGEHPEWYNKFIVSGVPLKGHNGIDFGLPLGSEIQSVDDGLVGEVGYDPEGFGEYVLVCHTWGDSLYAHLTRRAEGQALPKGLQVRAGSLLGLSGNTGNSTGPHLHFGIRVKPYRRDDGWAGYSDPLPCLRELDERSLGLVRNGAWNQRDIPYNPDAALVKYARGKGLGVPMTEEFDMEEFRCQGFVGGVVYVPIGYWDQVKHLAW